MSDGCGPPGWKPWAYFDRDTWSLRTHQGSLPGLETSCPNWPGETMWDGSGVYVPATSGHVTDASGGSSLLPTPTANNFESDPEVWQERRERERAKGQNGNGFGLTLGMAVQTLLPTPTVSDANGTGHHGDGGADLRTTVTLLPTPTTSDAKGPSPGHAGTTAEAIAHLLPTPTAMDTAGPESINDRKARGCGPRLTDAVSVLGAPTDPPSSDGSASTDPPPTLWTEQDG
jgi:hypothetical protein